jgi:hypothetical protein
VMLHVWNPRGGWWGEGDEKFFVDGEKFPSTFGTGSEDYFGYAWCCPVLFTNAFHNQTHNDGDNVGHVSVNRWQIGDNVPFQTGFEAAIEKYFPNDRPTRYAATAYWYLEAGAADGYPEVPLAERTGWYGVPGPDGMIEGENARVLACTGGQYMNQGLDSYGPGWSGSHLWWIEGKLGDRLTLALPVKADGRYRLALQMTKAKDYGIVQVLLDGQKLSEPVDLFSERVMPTGELDLGVHELKAGEHQVGFEIVGTNPKAVQSRMVGIDYLKLVPASAP